jgi:phospholipase/carboxylesterase
MSIPNNVITLADQFGQAFYHPSETPDSELVVLLHGWTGDEHSMWIFAQQLPPHYSILAPRGPIQAQEGGYGWFVDPDHRKPGFEEYSSSAKKFLSRLEKWMDQMATLASPIHWIGFSQGAILALTLSILYPSLTGKTAALSGFLPPSGEEILNHQYLAGKEFFIAHGVQDDVIPVDFARRTVRLLKEKQAQVTYCEEEITHKTGVKGLAGLKKFFSS